MVGVGASVGAEASQMEQWGGLRVEGERTTQASGTEHEIALYGHLCW